MSMATRARAVMVLGTTSGAGKSWLATALCRWYARQGLRVAPFKAQNMSNNARVVPGPQGLPGEIGSAQYFQAVAARVRPDVRMNPVLLKPESDTASQVVVMGQVRRDYGAMPWRERSEQLWPHARAALDELMAEFDVVVIEGAGSPAEINLQHCDFVNMRTALHVNAACLLVTDIDRGGAFAHLFGTHQLLPPDERRLIRGFVLNRFRGDERLLAPGPEQLQALTGVPTVAVIPMRRGHGLPEEDGLHDEAMAVEAPVDQVLRVAVLAPPRISNLDEFQGLRQWPHVRLVWARQARDLIDVDWVILPGSKHTTSDLAWLRAQGLDLAVLAHARQGRRVLGICGGLQMLGERILDPHGVESEVPDTTGLGLLALETTFDLDKTLQLTQTRFSDDLGPWQALAGVAFDAYEIHHGRTTVSAHGADTQAVLLNEQGEALGWRQGSVLGLYAHGLLEDPRVVQALFGAQTRTLDEVMDGLADLIDARFSPGVLQGLLHNSPDGCFQGRSHD
ncbi:MAG TPA: cobyric acid synthase [Aquabacterium sp.]|uniref:cobyric acid synthase n=1 Tax=Aquabacterium sp. TaxID=1872578 RepID=UPI002E36B625|nr:cobyric acid synthase [Aquabacterium sp.]HEX5373511.1 cobyric acid synthase [Aquabacterium sp.]